jgi:YbbR domain-containing protein
MRNLINLIKSKFMASFRNDATIIIYSAIISVLLWVIISVNIYPSTYQTLKNIPVTLNIEGTSAEANNLQAVSFDVESVDVRIQGERTEIGNLKASQLEANVVVENVTSAGEYLLAIEIVTKDDINAKFTVESINPSYTTVKFDEYATKEVEVQAETPNISVASGYYKDNPVCTPSTVEISGPKNQIDSITKLVVNVEDELKLDNYYTAYSSEWKLYSDSGMVDDKSIEIAEDEFKVDIPVYMKKELELTYTLKNVPSYFDENSIEFELSPSSIVVTSPNKALLEQTTLHIGYIDLRNVAPDSTFTFDIELPSGYQNLSGDTTVTAKLKYDNLKTKTFANMSNISIINAPSQYDISLMTKSISPVLVGPKEDIEKITDMDIVLEIDVSSILPLQSGEEYSVNVNVLIPNYERVWTLGTYVAVIQVEDAVEIQTEEYQNNDDIDQENSYTNAEKKSVDSDNDETE